MPQRDPKTGKELSGSAKRKIVSDRQKRAREKGIDPSAVGDFSRLPSAPIGDSARSIAWVNDAMLIAFDQVIRDATLTNIERWQWMERLGKALGMLRDKAAEQQTIKKALKEKDTEDQSRGTVSANGRTKKTISRPS
jgi:hypothetical protein